MGRFEIPEGWTVQAYRFALDPTPAQEAALYSHAGARLFAFNTMLAAVKANLDQRAAERTYGRAGDELTQALGWSMMALRREWNHRKHILAVREDGTPWWPENSKEAYTSGCQALADALRNWEQSRKGDRKGPRMGFPGFKSKRRSAKKFTFTTGAIRVEPDRKHVTLPRLGRIKTHESTRKLARRVENDTARITRATVRIEHGRWLVSFTCLVQRETGRRPAHVRHGAPVVGIDVGVKDLIVAATPAGAELERLPAPRELKQAQRRLRALQRKAARQHGPWNEHARTRREPSAGWTRTQGQISKAHARVANLRADRLHKLTTRLAQTHPVIGVETLAVKNMMSTGGARKRGLNRAIADAGLGHLLRMLGYKAPWYGSTVVKADRWHPSSKTCSGCGSVKAKLALSERTYACTACGLAIDRDTNAAVNLARLALAATTDPSAGFDTGGADRKTTPSGAAGGHETRTRPGDSTAAAGGSVSPEDEAA
jgi:putative transposase